MQKLKSIVLLFIMGIILFPWKMLCVAHPFGHSHVKHEPGKLSPCELHRKYEGKGTCFLPPMHCHKLSAETDDYQQTVKFQVKPPSESLAIIMVLFDFVKIEYPQQPYLSTPEPRCRSATVIAVNSLRGPPIC